MGARQVRHSVRIAAAAALAIGSALLAGSCWNPLNEKLQMWTYLDMVWIDGGLAWLGDLTGDGYASEYPEHQVLLSGFEMSRYEVTQGLFQHVMGYNPSYFSPEGGHLSYEDPCRPVERVTWLEAVQFCNQLSALLGYQRCYTIDTSVSGEETVQCDFTVYGFRLPTEAEWEYAARGGQYSEGYLFAGSDIINEVAVCNGDYTQPVGSLASNELGLYDMSGNVWEYVWDGWSTGDYSYFYSPPYSDESPPYTDPHGPFVLNNDRVRLDDYFVRRGGGFVEYGMYTGDNARVSARGWLYNAGAASPPASDVPFWSYDTGFRVVLGVHY